MLYCWTCSEPGHFARACTTTPKEGAADEVSQATVNVHGDANHQEASDDGSTQVGALDGIVRDRIRMALNGHVIVTVILDEDGEALGEPWCELMGLPETGRSKAPLVEVLEEDLGQFLGRAGKKTMADDSKIEQELRKIARRSAFDEIGKKPEVTVIISRLA